MDMMNGNTQRKKIEEMITVKKKRLELYYAREEEMLDRGVQSYGMGTRNLSRYNTDLATIRSAISTLEDEIENLEGLLEGKSKRKAVGVVIRDW